MDGYQDYLYIHIFISAGSYIRLHGPFLIKINSIYNDPIPNSKWHIKVKQSMLDKIRGFRKVGKVGMKSKRFILMKKLIIIIMIIIIIIIIISLIDWLIDWLIEHLYFVISDKYKHAITTVAIYKYIHKIRTERWNKNMYNKISRKLQKKNNKHHSKLKVSS